MAEERREEREIERQLAVLEADLKREQATLELRRWRRAELLGAVRREPESSSGIGGLGFVLGVGLVLFSLYSMFSNVVVSSGFLGFFGFGLGGFGASGFGWSLLPLIAGVAVAAFRPRAFWGWTIIALALAFIFSEVLSTLHIYFRPVTLSGVIIMLLPMGLGLGLMLYSIVRSIRRA